LNLSDPLNTKEIDSFLAQVKKLEEAAKKLVKKPVNVVAPISNPTSPMSNTEKLQTSQVLPEKAKKYLKWAVFAGAGWALYEVFTAGEEES
jgi:ribosomal protein L1